MIDDNSMLLVVVPFSLGGLGAFFLILAIRALVRPVDADADASVVRGGFGHHFARLGAAIHSVGS